MHPSAHIAEYRQNRFVGETVQDNPHRTVMLLLQGAIERTRAADAAIVGNRIDVKIKAINSAMDILEVLQASLDHDAGGNIADGLESLYAYVIERLAQANAANNREHLAEAIRLLSEIASAWAEIPGKLAEAKQG